MSYIIGIVLSYVCVKLSLAFLDQNFGMYFDDVALSVVVGCTIAVGVIILPWKSWRDIARYLKLTIFPQRLDEQQFISDCIKFTRDVGTGVTSYPKDSKLRAHQILADGNELIELKFSTDEIETILSERIFYNQSIGRKVSNAFASLAKYPPAFGLIGTVFGLVNLMRAISEGLDPTQTGYKMAIALVATLYGLVVANLVIAPIAEAIEKTTAEEKTASEIALQSVLLAANGVSLLKAQELLNSFVSKNKRISFIQTSFSEDEAA